MSVVYVYDISMRHLWHSCCVSIYDICTNSKSMAIYGLPMASIYDISTHSVSMACLWLAYGMSIVCRWQTCGTSRKLLWNICCIPRASLWNIYGIPIAHVVCLRKSYLAYVWHVPVIYVASLCGTCVACLLYIYCVCWHMEEHSFGISILHLWHVCGLSMVYLCNIYK